MRQRECMWALNWCTHFLQVMEAKHTYEGHTGDVYSVEYHPRPPSPPSPPQSVALSPAPCPAYLYTQLWVCLGMHS